MLEGNLFPVLSTRVLLLQAVSGNPRVNMEPESLNISSGQHLLSTHRHVGKLGPQVQPHTATV
jgi:hypothetical protein